MPKGAKVTFSEDHEPKHKHKSAPPPPRPQRRKGQASSKVASSSAKARRPRSSGSDAIFRRKRAPAPKPKPTGYDAEHGWLTPWKKIQYPVSPMPTLREVAIIETWKANHKKIRDGPLFVRRVVDAGARVAKPTATTATNGFDAFNSLPTYTARYERKYRQRPKLAGKLWLKAFLPQELWDVVDPSLRKGRGGTNSDSAAGIAHERTARTRFNLDDFSDNEDATVDDEHADDSEAEAEAEVDEVDEDWEDDEDEADDYNGEKYFDDGEKDDVVGDDYEAGDDLGGGEVEHEREFAPGDEFDV